MQDDSKALRETREPYERIKASLSAIEAHSEESRRNLEMLLSSARSATTGEPAALPSSAPTLGTAERPLRSGTVSQREIGEPILRAIMAGSKSTKSMLPELVEFWEDSSTLRLILRWPLVSGSITEVGGLGHASPC